MYAIHQCHYAISIITCHPHQQDAGLLHELRVSRELQAAWGGRHPHMMLVHGLILPRPAGGAPMGLLMEAMEMDAYDYWHRYVGGDHVVTVCDSTNTHPPHAPL